MNENSKIPPAGKTETPYTAFFEYAPIALYRSTPDGRIIEANQTMVGMLKCKDKDTLLKLRTSELYVDVRDQEKWQRLIDRNGTVVNFETRFRRCDGQQIWVRENARAKKDASGEIIFYEGSLEDISREKETQEKLLNQNRLLKDINRVFSEAMTCEKEEDVAGVCLAVAEEITSSLFGFVGKVNSRGRLDTLALSNPGWKECRFPESRAPIMIRDMELRGLWGRVVTEGKPVITNNPQTHPDSLGMPEGHPGLTAFLGVPLKLEDRAVGLIGLGNKEQGYNETDLRNIEELSLAFCEALRLKQTEAALKDSEARFRAIADLAHDAIIMADQNGNIIYWNQAAGKIFGYKAGEVMEKNLHELLAPERFKEEYREGLEAFSKSGNGKAVGQTLELEGVRKDGSEFPLELSMSGVLIQGSWHAIGIVRDITERKRMEKELERLSYQDGLTGVANRRLFEQTLDREWQRLARSKSPLALILLDIDYFKAFNDRYGHQKGDECLRQVARCIDGLLKRPADLVARYGGEEFALILPETGAKGAGTVAEKIRSEIQALGIAHASSPVAEQLTVSLGVAWFVPTTSSAPEDLVAAADEALYQAKSEGRNRVRWKEVTWQ